MMSIFDTFGFDGERDKRFMQMAQAAPRGLDIEQLVPGAIVTVGPTKCGDRSYQDGFFEVISRNVHVVLLKQLHGYSRSNSFVTVPIHERQFYAADDLWRTLQSAESEEVKP